MTARSEQPCVLLLTKDDKAEAVDLEYKLRAVLVRLGFRAYGLFVAPVRDAWACTWPRHDNGPIALDDDALRAQERLRGSR